MTERMDEKRVQALKRSDELKGRIAHYLEQRQSIPSGWDMEDMMQGQKERILSLLGGTEKDWDDWRWQNKHRINDVETLTKILNLSERTQSILEEVGQEYRWSISPYYLSLIDPKNEGDPIKLQAVPSALELKGKGSPDPMAEEYTSPAPCITRRYPDRLIIKITNQCAMYCRHCQRRRAIGEVDRPEPREHLQEAIDYVREHEEIRDVLLTGGDAFLLSDNRIDWLLRSLREIPHLEVIRLGSRSLVTMPQRVTPGLVDILSRYHPIYVNTQFNHPQEITRESARACALLSMGGIPLGNQQVLLKGINDTPQIVKKMNHELLKIRVRPYYIFHAKAVQGTTHFRTRVEKGMEIMEHLRGQTSGLAIPTYIINAPHGYGKTPVLPEYLISWGAKSVKMRTWEGRVMDYPNEEDSWEIGDLF